VVWEFCQGESSCSALTYGHDEANNGFLKILWTKSNTVHWSFNQQHSFYYWVPLPLKVSQQVLSHLLCIIVWESLGTVISVFLVTWIACFLSVSKYLLRASIRTTSYLSTIDNFLVVYSMFVWSQIVQHSSPRAPPLFHLHILVLLAIVNTHQFLNSFSCVFST